MPFIEILPSIRNISSILQENMGQPSSFVVHLFSNKCILSSFIFKCFLIKTLLTLGNIIQTWIPSALSSSIAKENNFDHMLQNVCSYVRLETLSVFIVLWRAHPPRACGQTKEGDMTQSQVRWKQYHERPYHFCDLAVTMHTPGYRRSLCGTRTVPVYLPQCFSRHFLACR